MGHRHSLLGIKNQGNSSRSGVSKDGQLFSLCLWSMCKHLTTLPLDVVGVSDVVALHLLVGVVQHDDSSNKVDNFASRQLVDVTPRITASVAIATSS